jgi:hypothetical protein
MTTSTNHRVRATLGINKKKIPALLALAKAIYDAMLANPTLVPAPKPALAVLLALITALDPAPRAVATRAKGMAAVRDQKRDALITGLESQRMYVQTLCDANPEQAVALIKAAAMSVARVTTRDKPVLQAKPGTAPGSVILVANERLLVGRGVHNKALFNWQMSADGGKTWTPLAATPLATTEVSGLTSLTTIAFRVCVTVGKVTGEWSQAITVLVK